MENDGFKICPFCKEKIRREAVKCRFCGEWFEQSLSPVSNQPVSQEPAQPPSPPPAKKVEAVSDVSASETSLEPIKPSQEGLSDSDASERKPLPKPVEKEVELPALKYLDVTPKKLYLAGTGFLFLGIIIIVWMFKGVDFSSGDPDKVTSLMAAMILKPILGAAALAWTVHGLFGKRKGYMFLVFAITWVLVMAWCGIKFREGFNESRIKSQEEHNQITTLASNFLGYAQNEKGGSLDKIKASLDGNKNLVLIPVMEFSKSLAEVVEKRDQSIAGLQKRDIYDLSLLTNKPAMQAEMQKRLQSQEFVNIFKTNVNKIIENTRRRYDQINAPEKDKLSSLHGFEQSITAKAPERENSYRLLVAQQKGEYDYLQFMVDSFKDYQIKDGKIYFSTDEALAGYNSHLKTIDDTEKEMADLRKTMLDSTKKTAEQLLQ